MSTKKRPGEEELRGLLIQGNFGESRELTPADPIAPTHLHLDIKLIKPYEHNPRRQRNPMYTEIKRSILAKRGLDDPIGVTRRPGEPLYTVRAGGNTRLTILKELLEETGDSVFERAHCIFTPWTSESDCIAAHLIENELRGELVFIDKALAIKDLMEQLQREAGTTLRRTAFLRKLAEIGYSISKRQLIRYEYAAEILEPLIPEALKEGLGGRKIDEIRDAEKKYRHYWNICGLDKNGFDPLFRDTLAAHDSDGWSLELALEDFEAKISEITGKSIDTVRLELDATASGKISVSPTGRDEPRLRLIDLSTSVSDRANSETKISSSSSAIGNGIDANASSEDTGRTDTNFPLDESDEIFEAEETVHDPDGKEIRNPNLGSAVNKTSDYREPDHAGTEPVASKVVPDQKAVSDQTESSFLSESLNEAEARQPRGTDLKSLRSRAYVLATRFAHAFDPTSIVHPSKNGYGFFVEIPKRPLLETGDVAWWGWWLLFSLSEQAVTKARLELAPSTMRLPQLLIEDRLDEAFSLIGDPPDAIQNLGHVFFSSPDLSEQAFRDLLMLIETCRILRNHFPEKTLWPCPTIDQMSKQ